MSGVTLTAPPDPTAVTAAVRAPATRLPSIDLVRGAVMVLMALDHVRAYLGPPVNPEDPVNASPGLFLTRWLTHFCAPAFVLLAGTGAVLRGGRGTRGELARFLLVRGLWLVALEFALVNWAWSFSFGYHFVVGQVIWAIGASMVALAPLVFLPPWLVGCLGVAILAGHNLFDGVTGA